MEKWPPGFRHRRVFEIPTVSISRWRCQGAPPRLGAERSQPSPMIVFAHCGNFRVHSRAPIGLIDCTRVGFFNPLAPFQSAHPFGGGDSGSDLAIRPDVLAEILFRYDPRAAERTDQPFPFGSGPLEPQSFLLLRTLLRKVARPNPIDGLEIEEWALFLADRLIRAAFDGAIGSEASRVTRREREEAEDLRGHLSSQPGRRHQLDTLARELDSTPFRLCRSFRSATGTTIHRYLTHVRLQQALGRLAEGSPDLSDLAFELGFSSHSHFTSVFRKHLGVPPETVRRVARANDVASLRRGLSPIPTAAGN
ncbi:MAG: helix-turn-helix transcriptional regulator [Thermoanaerobaculia bacterium]